VINVHERAYIHILLEYTRTRCVMGTRVRETPVRVSGVLADSVKADSPANGRPVFRGELSFERAERSTWRVLCRGIGCGESNFPYPGCIPIT
jgi:hypothetical protein